MGNYGHHMHLEAVELQKRCDSHLIDQIQKQTDRMDRNAMYMHELSDIIATIQTRHKEGSEEIDLTEIQAKVDEFKKVWENLREDWPVLDECPFSEELDLAHINIRKLDEIERKIDNIRMRIQNKYPALMLAVETATNLHKLLTDIMLQVSKSETESKRTISRNQRVQ